jgi:diphosphomevalonate decarboxylase
MKVVTTIAHPNIALIKYWGKRDVALNLPAVPSVSLTVAPFYTRTKLFWGHFRDEIILNGNPASDKFSSNVLSFLNTQFPGRPPCRVETENNFPSGAGLASSSSGFAALSLAAARATGQQLSLTELSILARRGSGSACRSLWGGFVRWDLGSALDGSDSHGSPIAGAEEWDVGMVVAIVSSQEKSVSSTDGMERSRLSSPYYQPWVDSAEADVQEGLAAIQNKDIERLGRAMEASTFKMHATMHTSVPPLVYWQPQTIACLHTVFELRQAGLGAWVTMDAGPQVKVLCMAADASKIAEALHPVAQTVHILRPGPGARLVDL